MVRYRGRAHVGGELDRDSLPLYPSGDHRDEQQGGRFYVHMLEQDVALQLLPVSGEIRRTDEPCARLLSRSQDAPREVQEFVIAGLSGERDSLASAVAEHVNQTAAAVVAHGRAVYEVAYYKQNGKPVGFVLLYLLPQYLVSRRGSLRQEIPHGTRIPSDALGEEPREITERERPLSADRLLIADWPPGYADGQQHVKNLRWLGRKQYPEFLIPKPGVPDASRVPYDFERFRAVQDRALAATTRFIGWNARGLFDRLQTGYYYAARHLRFERFKIALRDHLLAKLNDVLKRTGRDLGFDAQLQLQGLPGPADVDKAEQELAEGGASLKDIIERFSVY